MLLIYLGFIAFIAVRGSNGQTPCTTASGGQGKCVVISECGTLLDLLERSHSLPPSQLGALKKSQCGLAGTTPKVCCPSGSRDSQTPEVPVPSRHGAIPSLPDVSNHPRLKLINDANCGPVTEAKIVGGNKTTVLEFPWMALIGYKVNGNPDFQCAGSLINKRYVLTAAHCVTELPRGLELTGPVRLGEHDLSTERDCETQPGVPTYCADKYQDFPIEKVHLHENYESGVSANDIALIRIGGDADYRSANVRPICLPVGDFATLESDKAIVTGWGRTNSASRSQYLLKVTLGIVPNDDCGKVFALNQLPITHKQMCAGAPNKDSCSGDSGGPLQFPGLVDDIPKFVQYGIVSYGTKDCAVQGWPGVYTKVAYYLDWILDTIRD